MSGVHSESEPPVTDSAEQLPAGYSSWRRVHLAASWLVTLVALAHCVVTAFAYDSWTARAVWFLGAGLGMLLLGTLNLAHIGLGPCRMPTTRLVRVANWVFALYGVTAVVAVPEPQAFALLLGLIVQATAARFTLPGPDGAA